MIDGDKYPREKDDAFSWIEGRLSLICLFVSCFSSPLFSFIFSPPVSCYFFFFPPFFFNQIPFFCPLKFQSEKRMSSDSLSSFVFFK